MVSDAELLLCPFCGGPAVICRAVPIRTHNYWAYSAKCTGCMSQTKTYATPNEAVEAWNQRKEGDGT